MAEFSATSETLTELFKAIFTFQGKVGKVIKDAQNNHFGNRYATLNQVWEAVQPVLQECGLLVIQLPEGNGLCTTIAHAESGEYYTSWAQLANISDPQKQAGSITYMRRYALAGLGLVIDDDDDAEAATAEVKRQPRSTGGRSLTAKGGPKWSKNS